MIDKNIEFTVGMVVKNNFIYIINYVGPRNKLSWLSNKDDPKLVCGLTDLNGSTKNWDYIETIYKAYELVPMLEINKQVHKIVSIPKKSYNRLTYLGSSEE